MESKFGKNSKSNISKSSIAATWYGWKAKTGTPKTKLKSPKAKAIKPVIISEDKKARKSKERMDRIPSHSTESNQTKDGAIPDWVRESSEKKPTRKEWEESKLQWRKETKKSQRSFSKNKERDYVASKPKYEMSDEKSRKPFWNTFEKKPASEDGERKSSWDKNSLKPGTGFEKSKTGYKWVGSAWNKSTTPHKPTRTWDTDTEKLSQEKKNTPRGSIAKINSKKSIIQESSDKKTKYIAPKPTWEKNTEKIDKKTLKAPTQF